MSRVHPGRFNTTDLGAVYVSREPDTAIEELRRGAEVAGVAARLGAEAIRWPSATGAGQSIAVFISFVPVRMQTLFEALI